MSQPEQQGSIREGRMHVAQMDCEDCRDLVLGVLDDLPGVEVEAVDADARVIMVTYPAATWDGNLPAVLAEHGFQARMLDPGTERRRAS